MDEIEYPEFRNVVDEYDTARARLLARFEMEVEEEDPEEDDEE